MHRIIVKISLPILSLLIITTGCSSIPERNPLPEQLRDTLKADYPASYGKEHNYLAISGGGQNGAFGAGLLNGWTEAGTRPEFTIVTGVSTGALIAPFAFLGPEYDHVLKEIYTEYSTKDIVTKRGTVKTMFGDAAADSTPLQQKLAYYVDEKVMAAIAAEYKKGRILDIITTNLDAARPVAWNIGKIASDDSPYALQMIRDIMLASASIPAAFPPVIFDVEADGKLYDELHVDGGATSVLYLYPIGLDFKRLTEHMEVKGTPNVYTIRNGKLKRQWKAVDRNTLSIAVRTMQAQSSNVVLGDMYRIYLSTQRDGIDYHLAYIPDSFIEQADESFDKAYMNKLYEFGYKKAKDGYEWHTFPPGYEATSGN